MVDRTNNTVEFFVEAPDGTPIFAGKEYQWISGKDDYTGLSRVKTLDGKWGIIDEEGKEVLKAEYDSIWKFEGKQRYDTKVIKDGIEAHLQSSVEVYPKILHSLNMKKGRSDTPLS